LNDEISKPEGQMGGSSKVIHEVNEEDEDAKNDGTKEMTKEA